MSPQNNTTYPRLPKALISLLATLLASTTSQAADVIWNGSESNDWNTGLNWDNNTGPTAGDTPKINSGTVEFNDGTSPNFNALRLLSGTLTFSGGTFTATSNSSVDSHVEGTLFHTGTAASINELEIGRTSGDNAFYYLSGGSLKISRGLNGYSLYLGGNKSSVNAGTGTLEISGGSFKTRTSVQLGDATLAGTGNFTVLGSIIDEIWIASETGDQDGTWLQNTGSTLKVGVDTAGVRKIFIHDSPSATTGTSATFENNTWLDVDYYNGGSGGGTWTVMEVENGDIIDNGLSLEPGVNTSIWSFNVDNSGANGLLTVTATGTVPTGTVFWEGSVNSNWDTAANWRDSIAPVGAEYVYITYGDVEFSAGTSVNNRGLRLLGGALTISGGEFQATELSSAETHVDATLIQTGGETFINELEVGRTPGGTGTVTVSDGDFTISRGKNGYSLYLGATRTVADSGTGSFEISGGSFKTRTAVKLGDDNKTGTGIFTVLGSSISEISIAGGNDDSDGIWDQHADSILKVGIDYGGVTKVKLIDSATDTTGTAATFENGALLDVDYYDTGYGGGTWVVMEVENGEIIDHGLAFAPGVDTNVWSFGIDNSGSNGILYVTATGAFVGESITIGSTQQQKMRYGMDYERLWYWTGGLNSSERDDVARWSAVDTAIDFIRVAMNSGYELTEGTFVLSAYTNKIIPLMQEMKQANPNIKFFASPRPLDEAVSGASWQPYPLWVTDPGETSYTNTSYDFAPIKCAEYIVKYLLLMKSYGFKISFLDVTNEWQNSSGGRLTADDMDDIHNYLHVTYMSAPWQHPDYPGITLTAADIPELVGPSSHNYFEGRSWIHSLDSGDAAALSIASSHNTGRNGSAEDFVERVRAKMGSDTEIWNTEQHGWKSTSGANETTSFFYYLESIRAGFGGINGWLAIGTTNQGHAYILNPNGTPTRNVKYHIFQKLSSTSNYGYALDIIDEPDEGVLADLTNEYDSERNVAAFIKGNLMTVWVINENATALPMEIIPTGHTIATSTVRQTRWTDPSDVEGFETLIPVTTNTKIFTTIPGESVVCFEIVLNTETFANQRYEAEDYSHHWGTDTEDNTTYENVGYIEGGDWIRFGSVALEGDPVLAFSVARPSGRPDGLIRVREGHSEGPILGEVSIPETGDWQVYNTIYTQLDIQAGIYNLYLEFVEDETATSNSLLNIDWFEVQADQEPTNVSEAPVSETSITLNWTAVPDVIGYTVKRSTTQGGPYTVIDDTVIGTTYTDTGRTAGTAYYYVIAARYGIGVEGKNSDEIVAVPSGSIIVEDLNFEAPTFNLAGDSITMDLLNSKLGHMYQGQERKDLTIGDWVNIGSPIPGNGGIIIFNFPVDPTDTEYFYRIEIERQ